MIIEKYYGRLTQDFDTNKRVCEEVAVIQTKRLRNKIAGFTTVSWAPSATRESGLLLSRKWLGSGGCMGLGPGPGAHAWAHPLPPHLAPALAALDEAHPEGTRPRHLPEAAGERSVSCPRVERRAAPILHTSEQRTLLCIERSA